MTNRYIAPPQVNQAKSTFSIYFDTGEVKQGYIRNADTFHKFAYELNDQKKPIELPNGKGRIVYARVYQRVNQSRYAYSVYKETEEQVVIKELSRKFFQHYNQENPQEEITLLKLFGDDNHMISITEALQDRHNLYLIMPYFGDDLLSMLDNNPPDDLVRSFQRALVRNLIYLRKNRLVHRDLSLENVISYMLTDGNNYEIRCPMIDPAMALSASALPIPPQPSCGKNPYLSPEVYNQEPLTFAVDVWSTGVMFFMMWTRQYLYDKPGDRSWIYFLEKGWLEHDHEHMELFIKTKLDITPRLKAVQSLTPVQRNLLANMLRLNPEDRIEAEDIIDHPWFSS
eukprot:CAMPEP_0178918010 /NCGR_PEP_ID=MMETSP0786-20121207/13586_1 /TAXON_ID=186022 /ORGANISM="Thalassionema frauenfeldii, Strain CCMP 1798" /LENGTH=340 /DNA_ID=CAMNT_0020591667 /DNA_START=297 /DNA_END=1319 /DNA_ORIENTATION=+